MAAGSLAGLDSATTEVDQSRPPSRGTWAQQRLSGLATSVHAVERPRSATSIRTTSQADMPDTVTIAAAGREPNNNNNNTSKKWAAVDDMRRGLLLDSAGGGDITTEATLHRYFEALHFPLDVIESAIDGYVQRTLVGVLQEDTKPGGQVTSSHGSFVALRPASSATRVSSASLSRPGTSAAGDTRRSTICRSNGIRTGDSFRANDGSALACRGDEDRRRWAIARSLDLAELLEAVKRHRSATLTLMRRIATRERARQCLDDALQRPTVGGVDGGGGGPSPPVLTESAVMIRHAEDSHHFGVVCALTAEVEASLAEWTATRMSVAKRLKIGAMFRDSAAPANSCDPTMPVVFMYNGQNYQERLALDRQFLEQLSTVINSVRVGHAATSHASQSGAPARVHAPAAAVLSITDATATPRHRRAAVLIQAHVRGHQVWLTFRLARLRLRAVRRLQRFARRIIYSTRLQSMRLAKSKKPRKVASTSNPTARITIVNTVRELRELRSAANLNPQADPSSAPRMRNIDTASREATAWKPLDMIASFCRSWTSSRKSFHLQRCHLRAAIQTLFKFSLAKAAELRLHVMATNEERRLLVVIRWRELVGAANAILAASSSSSPTSVQSDNFLPDGDASSLQRATILCLHDLLGREACTRLSGVVAGVVARQRLRREWLLLLDHLTFMAAVEAPTASSGLGVSPATTEGDEGLPGTGIPEHDDDNDDAMGHRCDQTVAAKAASPIMACDMRGGGGAASPPQMQHDDDEMLQKRPSRVDVVVTNRGARTGPEVTAAAAPAVPLPLTSSEAPYPEWARRIVRAVDRDQAVLFFDGRDHRPPYQAGNPFWSGDMEAAMAIQATFRGYFHRRRYTALRDRHRASSCAAHQQQLHHHIANTVIAFLRSRASIAHVAARPPSLRKRAAQRIQRWWRHCWSLTVRAKDEALFAAFGTPRRDAADRQHAARRKRAAMKLSVWAKTRLTQRKARQRLLTISATTIQRAWRSFVIRRTYYHRRHRDLLQRQAAEARRLADLAANSVALREARRADALLTIQYFAWQKLADWVMLRIDTRFQETIISTRIRDHAVDVMQRFWRASASKMKLERAARRRRQESSRSQEEERILHNVITVQAIARRHLQRYTLAVIRADASERRRQAATAIQRCFRGFRARRVLLLQQLAATAVYRELEQLIVERDRYRSTVAAT